MFSYLVTQLRHLVCTALVELVATGAAVEALEQQFPTALAVRQRKECLSGVIVRNAGCDGELSVELHRDLFTF